MYIMWVVFLYYATSHMAAKRYELQVLTQTFIGFLYTYLIYRPHAFLYNKKENIFIRKMEASYPTAESCPKKD